MKRFVANLKANSLAGLISRPTRPPQPAHATTVTALVPPVPHPCPYHSIAVLVAPDGLLLRPHFDPPTTPESHLRILWGKPAQVESLNGAGERDGLDWSNAIVIDGLVGILELFSSSYLLVITAKSEIGYLFDATHLVHGVKTVTAIPLVEDRAKVAIAMIKSRSTASTRPSPLPRLAVPLQPNSPSRAMVQFPDDLNPSRSPSPLSDPQHADSDDGAALSSGTSTPTSDDATNMSAVAKALTPKLSFWNRLPKVLGGASGERKSPEQPDALDSIIKDGKEEPEAVLSLLAEAAPTPATSEERNMQLEEKILKECIREYTKGGMFFAYTFDITRSLQQKQELLVRSQRKHELLVDLHAAEDTDEAAPSAQIQVLAEPHAILPLWRRVDRQYWWNEWLSKPFVSAGLHSYVLPIMQGYYQISSFEVPHDADLDGEVGHSVVDYVIISRRSRDRAGLRYQRRGIDDDAHVANFVETETIMRVEREGTMNIFSYVQIRGSIPLFWSQVSNGLKPPPQLSPERTPEQNLNALRRHFQRSLTRYGSHAIVNLAEQQGKEGPITQAYRRYVQELDSKDISYYEYDFHKETKGMRYENISHLIETVDRVFDVHGFYWVSNNCILSRQKGVFRVNCIDCLDRTNVVQSAFARYVLNKQLGAVALLNPELDGLTDADLVFNDVWANNGDAISRAYAGTSALKSGFTRTGKRDLSGLLNDGVNSLARMYSSTFSDWFCQAVIDFMLGYRNINVFSEFLLKLQSTDPLELVRLSKIRAEAISTSVSRVLPEGERLLSGWTLFSPVEFNIKIGGPFEEKVLLLTVRALYIVSYDYTLEKVKMYTRVPLGDIASITKGAYILSPLEEASRDPIQNAGFVVTWFNTNQITRLTSYSVRNSWTPSSSPPTSPRSARVFGSTGKTPSRSQFNAVSRNLSSLSRILSDTSMVMEQHDSTFAAFKVLPIDPAHLQESSASSGGYDDARQSDLYSTASTCKEMVDLVVQAIKNACEAIGAGHGAVGFVTETDVVSLAEAQRMTTMYAKVEYGLKRLLWLGG